MNFCLVPFKNWFNFLIEIIYLNPNKAGLFEGSFFCDGGSNDPSLIFQEELIQYHIFKVDWKFKKCWHHLSSYVTSYTDVISLFATTKFQKIQKIAENSRRRKSSYLLNDMRNFKEIIRKNVSYDDIWSYKKPGLYPLSRKDSFLGKPRGGIK